MSVIRNVVKTNGVLTSWEEQDETFNVTYLNGKPSVVKSKMGRWSDQECYFTYNANGDFTGISGELNTQMLNHLIALASGMVTSSKTLTEGIKEIIINGANIVPYITPPRVSVAQSQSAAQQRIDYDDSAQFVESWANLSSWGASNVAVSAGKLFASVAATSGANKSWSIGAGETSRIRSTITIPAAGAGAGMVMIGVSVSAAGVAPANGNDIVGIGILETNQPVFWPRAVNGGTGTIVNLGSVLAAGTYNVSINIDDTQISFVLSPADGSWERRTTKARSLLTGGANAITNLAVWNSDSRLGSGNAIGPVAVRKSGATLNPRAGFEGVTPYAVCTADAAGQQIHVVTPPNYDSRKPSNLIIFCHGSGGTAFAPVDDPLFAATYQALLAQGYIIASHNQHGNNWGSQSAVDDLAILYQYCLSNFAIGNIGVIAQSMGGLSSLTAIAQKKLPAVAWLGIYPVCNLENLYSRGVYTSAINAAYGISGDYDVKTLGNDPCRIPSLAWGGLDMSFYASPSDTVVPKTDNTDRFSAIAALTARSVTVTGCTGAHGDASHYQPSSFVSFFESAFNS